MSAHHSVTRKRRKTAALLTVGMLSLLTACSSSNNDDPEASASAVAAATSAAATSAGAGAATASSEPAATTAAGATSAAAEASPAPAAGGAPNPDAVRIKVWAWYPEFKGVVDNFNATHKDIQVDWTNVGTGPDQYAKLKTAFKAGTGAPDVAMIEFQELPTFVILDKLVDMAKYGANEDKDMYAEWAWKQATDGERVFAIPVDGGPMALMYRKDLFEKHNIAVPKTWEEYADAAAKVKAADPKAFIASWGNEGGWINGLLWQAGCRPYGYSQATAKDEVTIKINAPECKKVFDFYGNLVEKGLMAKDPFFTADMTAGLDTGKYWSWAAAGWTPGYVAGALKASSGKWAVAPMPQWTAGANDQGDWGGSTFTVTSQSKHPKEATIVAREMFGKSAGAWDVGLNKAFLYPLVKDIASSPDFTGKGYDFFGGQKVNEIFVPVSDSLGEFQYTPFQDFVYLTVSNTTAEALGGKRKWDTVLDTVQEKLVAYAKQQGFKVKTG